jgi:uncharacterized protein
MRLKASVEMTSLPLQPARVKQFFLGLPWLACLAVVAVAFLGGGCGKDDPPGGGAAAADEPTRAQPRRPTLSLWLDDKKVTAEIAREPAEVMTGMMFRTNLPAHDGMLFVFDTAERRSFWMKNTLVALSLAYIDPEGVVREIHDLQPLNTNSVSSDSRRIMFVLEMNQGWFQTNNVKPGAVIRTEKGTLKETFFPFR